MNKLTSLIVLVTLVVVAAACSGPSIPALTLGGYPWRDGERTVYDVVDGNGKVGTSEFSWARDGDAWLLASTTDAGEVYETVRMRLDGATLRPLDKEKTIKNARTDATLSITYGADRVQMKAVNNGKDQSLTIDIPASVFDNDQLLMTLRAMPFAEGYEGSLITFVSERASKVKTTVRVVGREKVQTPVGSVDAWRLDARLGPAKHSVWYAVEAPYAMVQYDNGTTMMVLSK